MPFVQRKRGKGCRVAVGSTRTGVTGLRATMRPVGVGRSLLRFPGSLDDVTIWIPALDAHIRRLVPLFNELDPVLNKPIAKGKNSLSTRKPNAEVHPRRAIHRL